MTARPIDSGSPHGAVASTGHRRIEPRPYTLVAELSYQCPLHCPYCSNPVDIGGERWRTELETEHWVRAFREARAPGVLQLALTRGEPMLRRGLDQPVAGGPAGGPYSAPPPPR